MADSTFVTVNIEDDDHHDKERVVQQFSSDDEDTVMEDEELLVLRPLNLPNSPDHPLLTALTDNKQHQPRKREDDDLATWNSLQRELLTRMIENEKLVKQRALEPTYLISIDPGIVNLASIFGEERVLPTEGLCEITWYLNKMHIEKVAEPSESIDECMLARNLQSWLHQCFASNWELGRLGSVRVIIERQYIDLKKPENINRNSLYLRDIQTNLIAIFQNQYGCFTQLVHSHSYKKALGLDCGSYAANKEAAKKFCATLLEGEPLRDRVINNDHFADCINQVFYKRTKDLRRVFNKEFTIKMRLADNWRLDFERMRPVMLREQGEVSAEQQHK